MSRIHDMAIVFYIHIRRVSTKYFTGSLCSQSLNVIDLKHVSQYSIRLWAKQTYLFDCFRSQDNGMVITNTHTVFDPDSNTSEFCRPSIAIRNVDTTAVDVSIQRMAGRKG